MSLTVPRRGILITRVLPVDSFDVWLSTHLWLDSGLTNSRSDRRNRTTGRGDWWYGLLDGERGATVATAGRMLSLYQSVRRQATRHTAVKRFVEWDYARPYDANGLLRCWHYQPHSHCLTFLICTTTHTQCTWTLSTGNALRQHDVLRGH